MAIVYRNTNGSIQTGSASVKIENVHFGDTSSEPDAGIYTLSIGGQNYYVQTCDLGQNEMVSFKIVVPSNYTLGKQIKFKIGYSSAGTTVGYVFSCWTALLFNGDVIDTSLNANAVTGVTITAPGTANEFDIDNGSITLTDASGQINSIAVNPGDVLVGKLKRTDADASDFRLISLEITW